MLSLTPVLELTHIKVRLGSADQCHWYVIATCLLIGVDHLQYHYLQLTMVPPYSDTVDD